jgi:hypothetical protein
VEKYYFKSQEKPLRILLTEKGLEKAEDLFLEPSGPSWLWYSPSDKKSDGYPE